MPQNLDLPKHIPWQRLAYSPDLIVTSAAGSATSFSNASPHRWMSSISAFGYAVPEAESQEDYPERRIFYVKLSASITGANWVNGAFADKSGKRLDIGKMGSGTTTFQSSLLEQAVTQMHAYLPAQGAIVDVAVFPKRPGTELDDYPYIHDIEPKKRELYEAGSLSGEILGGSDSTIRLDKAITTSLGAEEIRLANNGLQSTYDISRVQKDEDDPSVDKVDMAINDKFISGIEDRTGFGADFATNSRETQSHTTQLSHIYQPLIAYNIGVNNASWVLTPRPRTVDSENVFIYVSQPDESGKILVGRQLEGIQEFFLVVNAPKSVDELCIEASIDTGHDMMLGANVQASAVGRTFSLRRTIHSCFQLGDGGLISQPLPAEEWQFSPYVTSMSGTYIPPVSIDINALSNPLYKAEASQQLGRRNQLMMRAVQEGRAAGFEPQLISETPLFQELLSQAASEVNLPLSALAGALPKRLIDQLARRGVTNYSDIIDSEEEDPKIQLAASKLEKVIAKTATSVSRLNRRSS